MTPSGPTTAAVLLHVGTTRFTLPTLLVLGVAGALSAVLLGLGLAVLARRQDGPYVLVVLALAALFARTAVAGLTFVDVFGPTSHHLLEHSLDVAMAGLVIGAVYHARRVSREVTKQ